MSRPLAGLALAASLLSSTALAADAPAPVPVAQLVAAVDIPHQEFTLPNGLRVVVSTDHKAPVVALSVLYHIGSKDEPVGQTGFAHLYEHLMFNGSEHAPGSYFDPLQRIGASDMNGNTWYDRTFYFETVPTGALETALFLEADRMGYLLGGIDQRKLDTQRAVVQNEKRQDDNQPLGLVDYAVHQALYPDGNPYQHTTIGSMTDLDQASLATVKGWFQQHYGPNNAVLALAGDIDLATAKQLVTRYFGPIARGPQNQHADVPVPTLAAPKYETMKDQIATTRLLRVWAVPGEAEHDTLMLDMAARMLGGIASSRLEEALVRGDQSAVSVSADVEGHERVSQFEIQVELKPGADPAAVNKRIDQVLADFLAKGPSADEVRRVATLTVAGEIAQFETVGGDSGRAATLAEGLTYENDPDHYKKELAEYAAATPDAIRSAAARWLSRPVYALTIEPGERATYEEAKAGRNDGTAKTGAAEPEPNGAAVPPPAPAQTDMAQLPPVRPIADLTFPAVTHAHLSNGMEVVYAQRGGNPITRVSLSFDAGNAADPADRLGTQAMTLGMLDEGTSSRTAEQIAQERQRLGASVDVGSSMDTTELNLFVPSPNAAAAIDLLADLVRNPAFRPADVDRVRNQQLAAIANELKDPNGAAGRTLPAILFGTGYPYGKPFSGSGTPAVVKTLTSADLKAFHDRWLRADKGALFVVSDQPLAAIQPMLEAAFGSWRASGAAGVKDFTAALPPVRPRILLIDRPGSPQSAILGGQILPMQGTDDLLLLYTANDVLGGSFLSRLNSDLRETKGWSYGVSGVLSRTVNRFPYLVEAPVQANKTGAAIAALRGDLATFLTSKGVTPVEFNRTITSFLRSLPSEFETGAAVLDAMQRNVLYKRPDDYYSTLATRYRAMTPPELDAAIRQAIKPDQFTWLVVGDAKQVRPQLNILNLPIEEVQAK